MPKMETKKGICLECGSKFTPNKHARHKVTCGPVCSTRRSVRLQKASRQRLRENRPTPKEIRRCLECDAEFMVQADSRQRLCSQFCVAKRKKWHNTARSRRGHCIECGKEYTRQTKHQRRCAICDQSRLRWLGQPRTEEALEAARQERRAKANRRVMQTAEIHGETSFSAEIECYLQRGGKISVIPPEPDRALPSAINSFRGGFQNYGQSCTPGYNLPLFMGAGVFNAFENIGETEPDPVV